MRAHPTLPGLFDPEPDTVQVVASQFATEKQISYARALAARVGKTLPPALLHDRARLSAWIDSAKSQPAHRFSNYPSAKQVQFAERLAQLKRREIPDACFKDRTLMSRWIDGHKPR